MPTGKSLLLEPFIKQDLDVRLLTRQGTCDGKSTVRPRTLLVRGSNLNRGFWPAKLPSFGRYSLDLKPYQAGLNLETGSNLRDSCKDLPTFLHFYSP